MSDFRRITENVLVSPQLALADIAAAAALGVTTIVNNRPDGEEPSAPQATQSPMRPPQRAELCSDSGRPFGLFRAAGRRDDRRDGADRGADSRLLPIGHAIDSAVGAGERQAGPGARCHRTRRRTGGLRRSPIRAMIDMLAAR